MTQEYIADHEPLTIKKITALLQEAIEEQRSPTPSAMKISKIQIRLRQGMTDSTTSKLIDYLYVSFLRGSGQDINDLAVRMYGLMQMK
jgi:hypothetical protein